MSRPENLYRLQQIDSQLDAHAARLQKIKAALADDQALTAARLKAQAVEVQLQETQKDLRLAEQDVQDQRHKIKQSEARLYSGKVSNPKELRDIQDEAAALKRYLDTLEERQLEAMLVVDEAQKKHDQAQDQLNQAISKWETKKSLLLGEKTQIKNDVETLNVQRQSQTANTNPDDLPNYENLRKKRHGVAVAKVQNRACSACGATLGTAIYQASRSPNQINHCSTCGRILYTE
ncbi:MAG: hypothetical protein U9Q82_00905 [Chloroflexota bacterium]|nr:hypothetical protein [Chloroflexota bacterium]